MMEAADIDEQKFDDKFDKRKFPEGPGLKLIGVGIQSL
jgi:hypothetical protein